MTDFETGTVLNHNGIGICGNSGGNGALYGVYHATNTAADTNGRDAGSAAKLPIQKQISQAACIVGRLCC